MKIRILLLLFIMLFAVPKASAQITAATEKQLDSLFQSWNTPGHPGGTVGVMKGGEVLYEKAFGLASLEYLVPNTKGTVYNTGSVSKQFTAMAIVLLHLEGKLSVDDVVRDHLPDLLNVEEDITIRHLLHHTSGLRSLHAMLELAGWRGDDARTNADLNRLLPRQKDLNFPPGTEYLYCNTGYMLMVNLVEKVTGEPFPAWMQSHVFRPLGLKDTYVEDKYDRIVPGNATSYYPDKEEGFLRAVEYWGYIGSGNMHSTTTDLLKWGSAFYDPPAGWEAAFDLMLTVDDLEGGGENRYGFGVVTGELNGHPFVQHGGAIGGFRAYLGTFPESELSVAVLTNFSTSGPSSKGQEIANLLLPKVEVVEEPVAKKAFSYLDLQQQELEAFTGTYWNDDDNNIRTILIREDTLRYAYASGDDVALLPIGKNKFRMLRSDLEIVATFTERWEIFSMEVTVNGVDPAYLERFLPKEPTEEDLKGYTGSYYSEELETTYEIRFSDGKLSFHHARHGDQPLQVLKEDVLTGPWPLNMIKYQRGAEEDIDGFYITNGRVRNAWFERKY